MQLSISQLQELLPGAKVDRRGKNLYATCPKCQHMEFGISLSDNHQFGCFRKKKCGFSGNIFTLLSFLGKSVRELDPTYVAGQKIDVDKLFVSHVKEISLDVADCKMPVGWRPISFHPYLESRGFTEEDYAFYTPGVTSLDIRYKSDFVIFPIRQFGAIKGYVGRNVRSKKEIDSLNAAYKAKGLEKKVLRWKNSDTDFSKVLLGLEEITVNTTTAIIVEGLFDKRNTDAVLGLRDQEEVKCCASFKCGMSDEQIALLQSTNVSQIVLLYDPDVISEIRKAASNLDQYFDTWVGLNEQPNHEGELNDPGDMTDREFDIVFNTLKTAAQFCRSRIDVPKLKRK